MPRLVINYKGLNSAGERIGYPFKSAAEIHQMIEKDTYSFVVMDLTDAYFQIPVSEESQHLLTFIVPQGRFFMKVLGQGWSSSGDYLNIYSRELLSGIPRSIKLIYNGCLQPRSAQETYDLTATVMTKAIKDHLKFSVEKFQVGPSTTFAGLSLVTSSSGKVTITPDPEHISHLLALPPPKCKQDILTLMEMLSTLRKWTLNLSFVDVPIRALTKKNTHFKWDSQLEAFLDDRDPQGVKTTGRKNHKYYQYLKTLQFYKFPFLYFSSYNSKF